MFTEAASLLPDIILPYSHLHATRSSARFQRLKHMNKFSSLTWVATVAIASSASAANITGTVTLKGEPPKEKDITPLKADAQCGPLHASMPQTKFYVLGQNSGLADVVVSIQDISGKSAGATAKPLVLDQKNCLYVPQILALQTGQTLQVKNSDSVMHNVHSEPKAGGNKEQNQVQMAKSPDLKLTFAKPEEFVRFKCDVHPWMFAWVSVFDHPYFCVSDKDGSFKIENVPAGKYKIKANHRKAGEVVQEIEVKDGEDAKVDFALNAK
jgi:plastocyanin